MITIYGKKTSINVRKVLWFLEILNMDYTHIINISKSEIEAMNPNGLVPVLKDNDFILWESNTILRYIANKFTDEKYYPKSLQDKAQVDKWLDWQASDFNNSWTYAFQAIVRESPKHMDKNFIELSIEAWNKCILIINNQLKSTSYIASDNFSIADIVIVLSLNRWYLSIGEKGKFLYVDKYFNKFENIKGFKTIVNNGTV